MQNMSDFDWNNIDCFCFDVDSTVCVDEAIDELAKYLNKEKEVKELTSLAMNGSMDFRTALDFRLNLMKPSRQLYQQFVESRRNETIVTPGIRELMALLHDSGKEIFLISGGMKSVIAPVAEFLNIPSENVFANVLLFHKDGRYRGFDTNQPTSCQGGKARVIEWLKSHRGFKKVVMVGDGATDMEASPPADLFIGFGGNVLRPDIRAGSPLYFTDVYDLIDLLRDKAVL